MANLSKYQKFGFIELHNLSKIQLADRIFKLWKELCLRLPSRQTYNFWDFQLSNKFCEKFYEETILFQLKFQKPISRCSILQKIKMSNFMMLK